MPRTVPSQLIRYLDSTFGTTFPVTYIAIQQIIGKVAGFLELYDQLPQELLRLSADDYATLVAAIATVRFATEQYRQNARTFNLSDIGPAISTARRLIATLKDEVPSIVHDLSFISDPVLQEMIGLDLSAVSTDLQSGEWKGATILAGSCCEALLLYGLHQQEKKVPGSVAQAVAAIWPGSNAPNAANLAHRSWDLFFYTEAAHHLRLITDITKSELGPAREYRNLIHPAKTVREKVRCDRGTAFVATGALEHVISDLRRTL